MVRDVGEGETFKPTVLLLTLKMEEEATSQGEEATPRKLGKQRNGFSPGVSRRSVA